MAPGQKRPARGALTDEERRDGPEKTCRCGLEDELAEKNRPHMDWIMVDVTLDVAFMKGGTVMH